MKTQDLRNQVRDLEVFLFPELERTIRTRKIKKMTRARNKKQSNKSNN